MISGVLIDNNIVIRNDIKRLGQLLVSDNCYYVTFGGIWPVDNMAHGIAQARYPDSRLTIRIFNTPFLTHTSRKNNWLIAFPI